MERNENNKHNATCDNQQGSTAGGSTSSSLGTYKEETPSSLGPSQKEKTSNETKSSSSGVSSSNTANDETTASSSSQATSSNNTTSNQGRTDPPASFETYSVETTLDEKKSLLLEKRRKADEISENLDKAHEELEKDALRQSKFEDLIGKYVEKVKELNPHLEKHFDYLESENQKKKDEYSRSVDT